MTVVTGQSDAGKVTEGGFWLSGSRLDADLLRRFRARGYETHVKAILRACRKAHEPT